MGQNGIDSSVHNSNKQFFATGKQGTLDFITAMESHPVVYTC